MISMTFYLYSILLFYLFVLPFAKEHYFKGETADTDWEKAKPFMLFISAFWPAFTFYWIFTNLRKKIRDSI